MEGFVVRHLVSLCKLVSLFVLPAWSGQGGGGALVG